MCDLDEGEWPEYVRYAERPLAKAAERRMPLKAEPVAPDAPIAAEA